MLSPKRTKFRKFQKGRVKKISDNLTTLKFGSYGIKVLESGRLSARVIEAVRRTMTRKFKRSGQIWIRVFPDIAVSKKPAEVRMGKGKGAPSFWISRITAGQFLFEMEGISFSAAKQAYQLAASKLPFKTQFVSAA